jgi:hypothetical protein
MHRTGRAVRQSCRTPQLSAATVGEDSADAAPLHDARAAHSENSGGL